MGQLKSNPTRQWPQPLRRKPSPVHQATRLLEFACAEGAGTSNTTPFQVAACSPSIPLSTLVSACLIRREILPRVISSLRRKAACLMLPDEDSAENARPTVRYAAPAGERIALAVGEAHNLVLPD